MKVRYSLVLAVLAGAALGAAAMSGLYAQAKPPAYIISETEVIDADAYLKDYLPKAVLTLQPFNGRIIVRGGKTVPFVGDPPKRIAVIAFDNIDQAQAWRASQPFTALQPLREKSAKVLRSFAVEGDVK
jgi:uncharacterized protein (DUF1330 family)